MGARVRAARTAFFAHRDALWDAVVAREDDLEVASTHVQLASRHAAL